MSDDTAPARRTPREGMTHYRPRAGSSAARHQEARSAARAAFYAGKDAAYRRALGLPEGAELPHTLGNAAGHARAARAARAGDELGGRHAVVWFEEE